MTLFCSLLEMEHLAAFLCEALYLTPVFLAQHLVSLEVFQLLHSTYITIVRGWD